MALFGCKRHTGFNPKSQRSMSNLTNLLAIDRGVRTEDDYLRVFSTAFSTNKTSQGKSMTMVAKITGEVSDQESIISRKVGVPQQFAAALAQTKTTTRSCYTPVFLGESAVEMDGVVFNLQTIIANGQPGSVCINTASVTNNIKTNTLLRILIEQKGQVDMSQ